MGGKRSAPKGPALIVMAKVPKVGAVKTRLARAVGREQACAIHRAFIGDLDERLSTLHVPVLWFHWPDSRAFHGLVPNAAGTLPQRGKDLGERLRAAFDDAFALGYGPVVVLGADVPHVSLTEVRVALARLASGVEVVLGAADDGGYYLLGLRKQVPVLFQEVRWGGARVYEATMRRAEEAGLDVVEVASCFDVDRPEDLIRLSQAIARDARLRLPRTHAVLAVVRATLAER